MGKVQVHPKGVILAQHPHQPARNTLRQNGGNLGSDSHDLYMGNPTQTRQNPFQSVIVEGQRVTAGQQHIPNGWCLTNIVDRLLETRPARENGPVSHYSGPRTVAAIGGTKIVYQQENPVGVSVNQSRHGALVLFSERIIRLTG